MSFKMSDNHDLLNDNDMYSFSGYEADDMCFNNDIAAPREKTLGNDFPRSDNLVIALAVSFHFVWPCC